jgi:hypothetical protein
MFPNHNCHGTKAKSKVTHSPESLNQTQTQLHFFVSFDNEDVEVFKFLRCLDNFNL